MRASVDAGLQSALWAYWGARGHCHRTHFSLRWWMFNQRCVPGCHRSQFHSSVLLYAKNNLTVSAFWVNTSFSYKFLNWISEGTKLKTLDGVADNTPGADVILSYLCLCSPEVIHLHICIPWQCCSSLVSQRRVVFFVFSKWMLTFVLFLLR